MNTLDEFCKGLDEANNRRYQEHQEFQTILGVPALFVPQEDDPRFGIGYWKAPGGVIAYRKYANGFDPYSRMIYPNEMIDLLNQVRAG